VAFSDSDYSVTPARYSVNAARGNGTSWDLLSAAPGFSTTEYLYDLEAFQNALGGTTVSWREGPATLHRWTAGESFRTTWPLPTLATGQVVTVTRMSPDGEHPIMVVLDRSTAVTRLLVYQYSCPLVGGGCSHAPNFWGLLGNGAPLNVDTNTSVSAVSVVLDSAGYPVVAWVEGNNMFAKRWTASGWRSLGTSSIDSTIGATSKYPLIAVGPRGHIVIAWTAGTSFQGKIVAAKSYNR
jgi:hypothetical protein